VAHATGREEIVVSTRKHGRGFRPVKLLLVGAIVAIRLVVPGPSKAQTVSWASQAHAAPNVSANALGQARTNGAVALGGFTSQGWPVVFELGRGGKMVTLVGVGLDLTCTSGDQFSIEDGWQLLDIAKNGKLHSTEQIPAVGNLTGGSHTLTGRFDRQRSTFRGVWSVQLNYQFADGTTDRCQSGKVKLIATL
jgi:hypothetical protein